MSRQSDLATEIVSIDWYSTSTVHLCMSGDCRAHYPHDATGREHLRSMPTVIIPERLEYIRKKQDGRLAVLERNPHLILNALRTPEIVSAALDYRQDSKHWAQTFIVANPNDARQYVAVSVSLANLDGDETEEHRVTTIYVAAFKNFYYQTNRQLKTDRWMHTQ